MASITSANAVYTISVPGVFNPVQLQQFSVDEIYGTDAFDAAEVYIGVDGFLAGGFVYSIVMQNISLMADSDSCQYFDQWYSQSRATVDIYRADGIIILPSINKKYQLDNGILKTYSPVSDAGRTLKQRRFSIAWQNIVASII